MNINDYLSKDEQRALKTGSDWRGGLGFLISWGMIVGAGVVVACWPHPLTVAVTLVVFANRQMALGVLLHDCSHRSWFRSRFLNDVFGHWFAGVPVLVPLPFYRKVHFVHHTRTGTEQDPDVGNISAYPVSKESMMRKVCRDFSGKSGLKNVLALLKYVNTGRPGNAVSMGLQKHGVGAENILATTIRNYSHLLLVHGAWVLLIGLTGHLELYLLWWIAFIFVYPFILRLRQVAEHGAMPAMTSVDVRDYTRTTLTHGWERLVFAPHYVNYHCEHHSLPTVAGYRLPAMHKLLKDRNFYRDKSDALVTGYYRVFMLAQTVTG
jgi:fatty acid desaturase